MKKTIRDIEWQGKRALVRCDFNVPLDNECLITDDTRIKAALPTIKYLVEQGASVVLMSHLGRPKGEPKEEFSGIISDINIPVCTVFADISYYKA